MSNKVIRYSDKLPKRPRKFAWVRPDQRMEWTGHIINVLLNHEIVHILIRNLRPQPQKSNLMAHH